MAVQQIIGKQITKFDTEKLSKNPNFIYHQKGQSKNGYWEYIVIPEPKTMEE